MFDIIWNIRIKIMRKILVFVSIIFSICFMFSQGKDFKSAKSGKMEIYWKIDGDKITFRLVARLQAGSDLALSRRIK